MTEGMTPTRAAGGRNTRRDGDRPAAFTHAGRALPWPALKTHQSQTLRRHHSTIHQCADLAFAGLRPERTTS